MGRAGFEPAAEDFQSPALPIELSPRDERRQPSAHVVRAKTLDEAIKVFVWDLLAFVLTTSSTGRQRFELWYSVLETERLTTTSPTHFAKEPNGPASSFDCLVCLWDQMRGLTRAYILPHTAKGCPPRIRFGVAVTGHAVFFALVNILPSG